MYGFDSWGTRTHTHTPHTHLPRAPFLQLSALLPAPRHIPGYAGHVPRPIKHENDIGAEFPYPEDHMTDIGSTTSRMAGFAAGGRSSLEVQHPPNLFT